MTVCLRWHAEVVGTRDLQVGAGAGEHEQDGLLQSSDTSRGQSAGCHPVLSRPPDGWLFRHERRAAFVCAALYSAEPWLSTTARAPLSGVRSAATPSTRMQEPILFMFTSAGADL